MGAWAQIKPNVCLVAWAYINITRCLGAWLNYLLPQITTQGFDSQSYTAIVEGIVRSIQRAHTSLTPGYLSLSKGPVEDANINRSPYAYEANPATERAKYGSDVDKEMTVLSFKRLNGAPLGFVALEPPFTQS